MRLLSWLWKTTDMRIEDEKEHQGRLRKLILLEQEKKETVKLQEQLAQLRVDPHREAEQRPVLQQQDPPRSIQGDGAARRARRAIRANQKAKAQAHAAVA